MPLSAEQMMPTERLPQNLQPMDPYFGPFFHLMRESLAAGGSELGLPMTLFSLAVSIRAASIVEIGRFKGLSTLALASALKFIEIGWQEPAHNKQRPDVDYAVHEGPRPRRLLSIDPFPTQDASDLLARAGLTDLVTCINHRSQDVQVTGQIDLLFIDGDHSYEGCLRDVMKFVPAVRPGGYFILHDYYGWYEGDGRNKSPIKQVIDQIPAAGFQRLLIDTGYQSFVIFRRPNGDSA